MDDSDIAAYSVDVSSDAEGYQTLSEKEHENKEKAKKMKKELAEKKKKLKKMEAKKKKQEKARKAAEEKRDRENKVVEQVELTSELEIAASSKKGEAPIPMDSSAMNAYSLAVAHVAENSEPDMPTNYGTETERQESGVSAMTSLADKEIGSLFSRGSKEHLSGASLGIELL